MVLVDAGAETVDTLTDDATESCVYVAVGMAQTLPAHLIGLTLTVNTVLLGRTVEVVQTHTLALGAALPIETDLLVRTLEVVHTAAWGTALTIDAVLLTGTVSAKYALIICGALILDAPFSAVALTVSRATSDSTS